MAAVAAPEMLIDSAAATPYASAASSPRGLFASAPASPSRSGQSSSVPFYWEEAPGTPKQREESADFEFGRPVAGGSPLTATADELFQGGVIRPLQPPPRLHSAPAAGTRSPKRRARPAAAAAAAAAGSDPFERAMEEATRGRAAAPAGATARRAARSLSPPAPPAGIRGVLGFPWWSGGAGNGAGGEAAAGGSWKWKLKDLFLFRSKSEGRATGNRSRDVLGKYTARPRAAAPTQTEDARISSFRSVESHGSSRRIVARDASGAVGGSSRRGISAHELHYTARRAVTEEQRKKTFLPYRQGLLSCLGFTPQLPIQDFAKSFGSFSGQRS